MAVPRERTELENLLIYGVDLKRRTIHFGMPLDREPEEGDGQTDFTQTAVEITVRAIRSMEADHPKKPISLYMNSFGGEVDQMLYLKSVIEASTCQFKFYGGGIVQSAATWIMAVCDERYL